MLRSYLGRTDPITQLPHRYAFFDDLRKHLHEGVPHAWVIAIDVAPVQRFNAFIRAMGHAYADELMRTVAARPIEWIPPDTRLYQVGATRFAAVLPDQHLLDDSTRLDDLVARLRRPFDCLGIPLTIQPGVGLLKINANELRGGDPLRLVMNASHAAQQSPRGWAVYNRMQDEQQRQEFLLVTELAAALNERTELDLHYQPRWDLDRAAAWRWKRWHAGTIPRLAPSLRALRGACGACWLDALADAMGDGDTASRNSPPGVATDTTSSCRSTFPAAHWTPTWSGACVPSPSDTRSALIRWSSSSLKVH